MSTFQTHLEHHLKQHSPKVDVVDIPLPEADSSISSSGQHVTFWALGKRWELKIQILNINILSYGTRQATILMFRQKFNFNFWCTLKVDHFKWWHEHHNNDWLVRWTRTHFMVFKAVVHIWFDNTETESKRALTTMLIVSKFPFTQHHVHSAKIFLHLAEASCHSDKEKMQWRLMEADF